MVIDNRSDPDKNGSVQPLVDFCLPHYKYAHNAAIFIFDEPEPGYVTHGAANKFNLGTALIYGRPSTVEITVSRGLWYPVLSTHRKSVGEVRFENWKEEVLFVLAHELRHIDQFWSIKPPRYYEVDAEKHAVHVLSEYRTAQRIRYKKVA